MKKSKILVIVLFLVLVGLFLTNEPLNAVDKNAKLSIKPSSERQERHKPSDAVKDGPRQGITTSHDSKTKSKTLGNTNLKRHDLKYKKELPRLGEVKEINGKRWETLRDTKDGKIVTVLADHIIVYYKEDLYFQHKGKAVYEKLKEVNLKYGIDIIKSSYRRGRHELVSIPKGDTKLTLIEKLKKDPNVLDASLDYMGFPLWEPSDKYYVGTTWFEQWYLKTFISGHSVYGGAANMPGAWDLMGVDNYGGDPNIRIANLDTGICWHDSGPNIKSPELGHMTAVQGTAVYLAGLSLTTPSVLVTNNTDAVWRADTADNDWEPYPDVATGPHGTETSGIHSNNTNNADVTEGFASTSWQCSLIPVKIFDGATSALEDGIDYATELGADVLNMSVGFSATAGINAAINASYTSGAVLVGSAGNDYQNLMSYPAYHPKCISVGMVESDGTIACPTYYGAGTGSDYGDGRNAGGSDGYDGTENQEIDIVAGGGAYFEYFVTYGFDDGTLPTSTGDFGVVYGFIGTSYSSPIVAGITALMASKGASNDSIRTIIHRTANYLDTDPEFPETPFTSIPSRPDAHAGNSEPVQDYNWHYGFGLIDAEAAVFASGPVPSVQVISWQEDGSGDSVLEAGESNKDFVITIKNVGSANALNITVDIATSDYYTVLSNNLDISYSNLGPDGSGDNSGNPILISVASDCPVPRDAYFQVVISYEDSSEIKYTSRTWIYLSYGAFDVVVLDADGGDTGGTDDLDTDAAITEALTANGFTYTIMKDYLPNDISGNHVKTIFIAQGNLNIRWGSGYTVEVYWGQIHDWLAENSGHNLYVEGIGIGRYAETDGDWNLIGFYENQNGTAFYSDYLHAENYNTGPDPEGMYDKGFDTDNVTTLLGQNSTVAASLNFGTNVNDTMGDSWNNWLTAVNGGTVIWKNQADNLNLGIQYDGGSNYKVVYQELFLCCFDDGASTKADYISSIMNFFGYGTSVPDTTPPAEPTLTATISAFTEGKTTLSWLAPGDDGWNGSNSGGSYDIRYVVGNNPGFTWSSAIDPGGEPAPAAPYSPESYSISVSTGSYYTFRLSVTDDSSQTVYSNDAVIYVEGWSSPGCESLASGDMVALVEWIGDESDLSVPIWMTELSANDVIYDFYQDELPADLSGYTTLLMIAGDPGLGLFLDNASDRQAVEDFCLAGGDLYFEAHLCYPRMEDYLETAGDLAWISTIFALAPDGTDFYDTYEPDFITTLTLDAAGSFGSQNYTYSAKYYGYPVPDDEIGTALKSFTSQAIAAQYYIHVTEHDSGTFKAVQATMMLNRIASDEQGTYVSDFLTYMGFGAAPPDLCEPTTITDLAAQLSATDLSVNLTWSAPGDDDLLGTGIGAVTTYEIRYSVSVITEGNFNSATLIPNTMTPQIYGSYESFITPPLPSSGTYYFAIKSYDDQAFPSFISNVSSIYLPSSPPSPKVIVYSRVGVSSTNPYDGERDDFGTSTRTFDPILFALEDLGIAYDLYVWDFPPDDPGPTNPLLKYDVMFICGAAEADPSDPDEGCIEFDDTFYIMDFLANGGRLYQEESLLASVYGDDYNNDVGYGPAIEATHWPYFGVTWDYFRSYEAPCEAFVGVDDTFTEGMVFKYDGNGPLDFQPSIHAISETGARGINAFDVFYTGDDPLYPNNTYPLAIATWIANDTVGAKTIAANEYFGALSTYNDEWPNYRAELMRRILQFFDFGGVQVFEDEDPILYPKWSSDSQKVAFIVGEYGSADITVIPDVGIEGDPTPVRITNVGTTSIHHLSGICWDQNDQYLLFVSTDALYSDLMIYRVLADNSQLKERWQPVDPLNDWNSNNIGVGRFTDPDVSHAAIGGKYKIIATNFGEIWAYNADGSGDATWDAVQVTDFQQGVYFVSCSTNPKVYQPRFSPNDDSIVFVHRPGGIGIGRTGIYILTGVLDIINGVGGPAGDPPITLDDSRITEIYPPGFYPCWSPSWTLDGNYIAFCMDLNNVFDNTAFWTDPDTQIQASNFDVVFRDTSLSHNVRFIQETQVPEGFEEWSYSGGDKYVYSSKTSGKYKLMFHGPEALEGSGISRNGASKNDILIVNDHSKSYVKMATSGYGDVKLSIKTPVQIKAASKSLKYIGEAREIQTYPGGDEFRNGAELVVHYTKQEAEGLNQRSFNLYFYDKTRKAWFPIDSVLTTYENGGYVSAKVYKQGTYAIFSGKKASAYEDLSKMRTFPNPYRPNDGKALTGTKVQGIVLDRLPDDIDKIKVYNIAGDLVATSDNGAVHYFEQSDPNWIAPYLTVDPNGAVAIWYGNNDNDKRVASGVYLITIKTTSGHEEVKKVAVIW